MIFKEKPSWHHLVYVLIWTIVTSMIIFVVYAKPDVHCVLKSRTTFVENEGEWDCQYICENGQKTQVILPKRYRCPARLFEKDRS
tara:strand:+ start:951 stop:1205 length:255 start_codon:yes stop_codon:yes gene_type:complete